MERTEGAKFMRVWLALILALVAVDAAPAQAPDDRPPARYGVESNLRVYPQGTPKQTLASLIEAYEKKRYSYVLAQLALPSWVDQQVSEVHKGDFDAMVKVLAAKFADDPGVLGIWKRYLREGEWEGGETSAAVRLKDLKNQQMSFRKIGKLWYMENKLQADKKQP
jgi:hypothetical protein